MSLVTKEALATVISGVKDNMPKVPEFSDTPAIITPSMLYLPRSNSQPFTTGQRVVTVNPSNGNQYVGTIVSMFVSDTSLELYVAVDSRILYYKGDPYAEYLELSQEFVYSIHKAISEDNVLSGTVLAGIGDTIGSKKIVLFSEAEGDYVLTKEGIGVYSKNKDDDTHSYKLFKKFSKEYEKVTATNVNTLEIGDRVGNGTVVAVNSTHVGIFEEAGVDYYKKTDGKRDKTLGYYMVDNEVLSKIPKAWESSQLQTIGFSNIKVGDTIDGLLVIAHSNRLITCSNSVLGFITYQSSGTEGQSDYTVEKHVRNFSSGVWEN